MISVVNAIAPFDTGNAPATRGSGSASGASSGIRGTTVTRGVSYRRG